MTRTFLRHAIAIWFLLSLGSAGASGQSNGDRKAQPPPPPSQPSPPQRPGTKPAPPKRDAGAVTRPWSLVAQASNVFDSNIDHELDERRSYGVVLGAGARYQNDPTDPTIQVAYQLALHQYTETDRWDRISQNVTAAFERDLTGPWKFETLGEISLKGTSEDRELSNQYIIVPRLQYKLDDSRRLRFYGAYRLRRFDEDPGRNATNRYLGAELTQHGARRERWDLGLRYEINDADSPRHEYLRWTYEAEYTTPLASRDQLELDLKFRLKRYRHRVVEIDDRDFPRRDHHWLPSITWVHPLNSALSLRLGYGFETRSSNDPDKDFGAHQVTFAVTRRWP